MTGLKPMTGEELIKKIYIKKEKDLRRIKLKEGTDLSSLDGYLEMNEFLRGQDLKKSPVLINGSDFSYVKASGLHLPYARGQNAMFCGAGLWGAKLWGAELWGAGLWGADLREAKLARADLWKAYLWRANLQGADLYNVKNLCYAHNLKDANILDVTVARDDKETIGAIKKALAERRYFIEVE